MGAHRSIRRTPSSRSSSGGNANGSAPVYTPVEPIDPARVITLDDGMRPVDWGRQKPRGERRWPDLYLPSPFWQALVGWRAHHVRDLRL